jgi:hypothetical protein
MALIEVEATVAGSRPMDAYGGIQLDRQVLEQLADALRAGRLPMLLQHDPSRPLHPRILDAGVARDDEGFDQVWIRFEIEEAVWAAAQTEWHRAGGPGGFSWSGSVPLRLVPAQGDGPKPTVAIAADAHFWTDEQVIDVATKLSADANVYAQQRLAFAHTPDPVVVISLYEFAKAMVAAGLWEALKGFLRRRQGSTSSGPTIFEFRLSRGDHDVIGRVTTNDAEVLHRAIDALASLEESAFQAATWNDRTVGNRARLFPPRRLSRTTKRAIFSAPAR